MKFASLVTTLTLTFSTLAFAQNSATAPVKNNGNGVATDPADRTETSPAPATKAKAKKKSANVPLVDERPENQTYVFNIAGMHCEACVATLQKTLCEKESFQSCHVALVDPAQELGQIRITPRPGQIVDFNKLKAAAKDSGYTMSR